MNVFTSFLADYFGHLLIVDRYDRISYQQCYPILQD